jgi:hypothetical protein
LKRDTPSASAIGAPHWRAAIQIAEAFS